MIKVLDGNMSRLCALRNVSRSSRMEKINGENILDFTVILSGDLLSHLTENSVFEIDDDYFDVVKMTTSSNDDGTYTADVESAHVSYRLNDPKYNKKYFTRTGDPSTILDDILDGTGFSNGGVEFSENVTYSAQEAKSRRQILMEFVATLKGEIKCDKFSIKILKRRGSTNQKIAVKDRNVTVISKTVDKQRGKTSYLSKPLQLPGETYELGDNVRLIEKELGISKDLRVTSIQYNPYLEGTTVLEFANYTNGLEDDLYRIETQGVSKDALYNGCRIGPEFGFEAIRNDKKARSYFRSDGMKFQSGDGTGDNWKDRLYYDYDSETDETILVFDGKLTVGAIEAIKAKIDLVVSETVIVNNLYAQRGRIAELTVNHLMTGDFLKGDDDIFYIDIEDQHIKLMEAHKKDAPQVQYTTLGGSPLFWIDDTKKEMHTDETEWPVMVYQYDSVAVMQLKFDEITDNVGTIRSPVIIMGQGDGQSANSSKGRIYKDRRGVVVEYAKSGSADRLAMTLTDDGIKVIGNSGADGLRNIHFSTASPAESDMKDGDVWFVRKSG